MESFEVITGSMLTRRVGFFCIESTESSAIIKMPRVEEDRDSKT